MIHSAAASPPRPHAAEEESAPRERLRMGSGRQLPGVAALPLGTHVTRGRIYLLVSFLSFFFFQTVEQELTSSAFIPLLIIL